MTDRELPKKLSQEDWEAVHKGGFIGSCQPFDKEKWREYLIAQQGDPGVDGFCKLRGGLAFAMNRGILPFSGHADYMESRTTSDADGHSQN